MGKGKGGGGGRELGRWEVRLKKISRGFNFVVCNLC